MNVAFITDSQRRPVGLHVFCLTAAVLLSSLSVRAEESVDPQITAEPAQENLADASADQTDAAIRETLELMRQAETRLADAKLDDETAYLQQRILANLEDLLEQAANQKAERVDVPMDTESDSESQTAETSEAERTGSPDAGGDSPSGEGDSSETPRQGGDPSATEVEQRLDLATSVWGHLPPRKRDRMQGAFSERFLPAYDELVRRYYEALATDGDSVSRQPQD
ncbi:MAG: hypothetical protein DWQ34_00800 [Planctomycetota bacterium]|nr:MAG: hypothetical protein DWQ29_00380 [Planctomycetota bacterium]REJ97909.1 MAG: hypothetical protein DWQ34_00800 [Planctomycetota bacterium]REK25620.1 MAG: hypothetical protein DWQ41_11850 [Planctomycetota bacterium]REK31669.1 MAG: hypothetical protein DWQ45_18835 [Planctomycetota bacterium]